MKHLLKICALAIVALLPTSCLLNNLDDLDTYTGCDITSVYGVYHRYYGDDTIPASGEVTVHQSSLTTVSSTVDADAATVDHICTIGTSFPSDEANNVTASNLVVILNISTAATIEPVGNAPALGTPGDWTSTNSYKVTAGDGSTKTWKVTVTLQ